MENTIAIITSIISSLAVIGSIITVIIAWKRAPIERQKITAEAESQWQQIAIESAKQVKELTDRIQNLEEKVKDYEDLKDWADRLVHQVKSLGGTPVPFKKKTEV